MKNCCLLRVNQATMAGAYIKRPLLYYKSGLRVPVMANGLQSMHCDRQEIAGTDDNNGCDHKQGSNEAYEKFMAGFHQFCPFKLNLL